MNNLTEEELEEKSKESIADTRVTRAVNSGKRKLKDFVVCDHDKIKPRERRLEDDEYNETESMEDFEESEPSFAMQEYYDAGNFLCLTLLNTD